MCARKQYTPNSEAVRCGERIYEVIVVLEGSGLVSVP